MNEVTPRFEFRVFAAAFGRVGEKIRESSECVGIQESRETYLVGSARPAWDHNVKVRDGALELKELVERRGPLERWKPAGKHELPISGEIVRRVMAPALGIPSAESTGSPLSLAHLVQKITGNDVRTAAAWIEKQRFHFEIDGCPVEIDEVRINGASLMSVAAESEDSERLSAVIQRLGLADYENVSYPRAIRCVVGLETMPGQPWHEN